MIHTLLSKIVTLITAPVFLIGSLLTPATVQTPQVNLGASLPQAVGIFETSLASPISSSATSFTLSQNAIRGGGTLSGYNCFTIDEGTSQAEIACGTVSSTAVTSVTRGVSYEDGVTSVAGNKFAHRRGANVKITDYPVLQILKAQNNGEYTYPNILKYDTSPTFSTSTQIVSKGYVDGVAIAGGVDASTSLKGISKLSYAPASSTNPISVGDNDPRVPTQSENDALAGTSGTPSSSNKYVTNDDTATAATADKVARRLGTGNITVITESANDNSTKAASTAYVDTALDAVASPVYSLVSTTTLSAVSVPDSTLTKIAEFTGLTGDTDDDYYIEYEASASGGVGSSATINLRLNDDSGNNYDTKNIYFSNTTLSGITAGSTNLIRLIGATAFNDLPGAYGDVKIKATKTIAGTSRSTLSNFNSLGISSTAHERGSGSWSDTTNQITSIQFYMLQNSGSTRTVSGKVSLYKINRQ